MVWIHAPTPTHPLQFLYFVAVGSHAYLWSYIFACVCVSTCACVCVWCYVCLCVWLVFAEGWRRVQKDHKCASRRVCSGTVTHAHTTHTHTHTFSLFTNRKCRSCYDSFVFLFLEEPLNNSSACYDSVFIPVFCFNALFFIIMLLTGCRGGGDHAWKENVVENKDWYEHDCLMQKPTLTKMPKLVRGWSRSRMKAWTGACA